MASLVILAFVLLNFVDCSYIIHRRLNYLARNNRVKITDGECKMIKFFHHLQFTDQMDMAMPVFKHDFGWVERIRAVKGVLKRSDVYRSNMTHFLTLLPKELAQEMFAVSFGIEEWSVASYLWTHLLPKYLTDMIKSLKLSSLFLLFNTDEAEVADWDRFVCNVLEWDPASFNRLAFNMPDPTILLRYFGDNLNSPISKDLQDSLIYWIALRSNLLFLSNLRKLNIRECIWLPYSKEFKEEDIGAVARDVIRMLMMSADGECYITSALQNNTFHEKVKDVVRYLQSSKSPVMFLKQFEWLSLRKCIRSIHSQSANNIQWIERHLVDPILTPINLAVHRHMRKFYKANVFVKLSDLLFLEALINLVIQYLL